jgi:hypothetical protein
VVLELIREMCSNIELLQTLCDADQDSTGSHRAFKTIILFQHNALPTFFEIALANFKQTKDESAVLLLGQILTLSAVKLQTARNQMDYKMQLR